MITALKRIVEEFVQQQELERALTDVVSQVKEAMSTECCSLYLADHEQQHFLLMATDGLSSHAVGEVVIGFNQGLVGLVGQREEPVNVANAQAHPRFLKTPQVQEDNFNSFLGTPIIHQRKVLGVMSVQQTNTRVFGEDEVAFLVTLAAQLASAIANVGIQKITRKSANKPSNDLSKKQIEGVPGSAGIAIATAYVLEPEITFNSILPRREANSPKELIKFQQAIKNTRNQLGELAARMNTLLPSEVSAIFDVYNHLLSDASLGIQVNEHINAGWNAATSLKFVIENTIREFSEVDDDYIRERVTDIRDIGQRVLVNLMQKDIAKRVMPEQFVLVADEVTASMLAELPRENIKGICSRRGSSSSHASILASALGIPAVMGLNDLPINSIDGHSIVLDGYSGHIYINADESIKREYKRLQTEELELNDLVQALADKKAVTIDGTPVALHINTGLVTDFDIIHGLDIDGIGLYRTEIPFMIRQRFPTESEQVELYKSVLQSYPDKPVCMRTLDVGGDKPLPYFPLEEDNPFLGWRGIRMTLDHPEIQLVQMRAMLRANIETNNLNILLPMITSISEVEESIRLLNQAYAELTEELKIDIPWPKLGVMLEVPAAIYQIEKLASLIDYFSIGTNDLTQYLLAVDRNNARVANLYDYYHPGVLQALQFTINECNKHKIPVTICGEMAGEAIGIILLLAMGCTRFSMSAQNLLKAKWILRHISLQDAHELLAEISVMSCPKMIREVMIDKLEQIGLGGFIRAGK
ncbi:phosphoenolpyruvate--protein phosphotransferase [Algibacillus agarilyticus]|uniref:phosphoenolpyruvate--protein phosphotransferase n=1 Tax=Algibacillus agarilyticus TaxID=2234133 RepID=UPI000DCF87B7|nr:phosphoenolpyruvate--protein phosphotransferase [Algibacillus agarilyticus]